MAELPSSFAPLRHPAFRALWTATAVSNIGTMIQGVAAAWLMTLITNSADMVALVQTAATLPVTLFAILGGAIADTYDRRRIMLTSQIFMLLMAAILTGLAWFGLANAWAILALTFLIGCGTALGNPSYHATIGDIVPREELVSAVALNSIGFNIARTVGPAIGGAIVAFAGAASAFAINTLSFLAVIGALLRWRPGPSAFPLPPESVGGAISSGLRYLAMSPHILSVILRSFYFGATVIAVVALLPLVAADLLGGDAVTFGLLLGAYGVGAVAGAILSGWLRHRLGPENVARLSIIGFAICTACAAAGHLWLAILGLLLGGASWVLGQSLFNVSVQLSAPRWVVGRALSVYQTATFGGMALGSWLWGVIATGFGIREALVVALVAIVVGLVFGSFAPLPIGSGEDLVPSGSWQEPATTLDIRPQSGPVHVEIGYRIPARHTDEFLRLMIARKRIRRRDGALGWTLLRDIHDPDRWIERYRTARWIDYVRHNMRRTRADAEIHERLRELHQGPGSPEVHRYIERHAGGAPRAHHQEEH